MLLMILLILLLLRLMLLWMMRSLGMGWTQTSLNQTQMWSLLDLSLDLSLYMKTLTLTLIVLILLIQLWSHHVWKSLMILPELPAFCMRGSQTVLTLMRVQLVLAWLTYQRLYKPFGSSFWLVILIPSTHLLMTLEVVHSPQMRNSH